MTKRFGRRFAGVLAGLAACAVVVAGPAAASTGGAAPRVLLGFGDSVAGGYGLPLSDPPTPYSEACARSDSSYVNLAAAALERVRSVNYACAGAVTTNVFLKAQSTSDGSVPVQLKQALSGPRPTYTVTTVGANDVEWSTFLVECLESVCATDANTAQFKVLLAKARLGLLATVAGEELLRPRRVILTGYYDPFEGDPTAFGLGTAETSWYQARLADVNAAIQDTVRLFPNATYMPVSLIPTDTPLVQVPGDPGPFHPTAAGQRVIAGDLVAVINGLR